MSKNAEEFGTQPPKTGVAPKITGFTPVNDLKVDEWDRRYTRQFADVLRLADYALIHAKENAPEGWGFNVDVTLADMSVKITTTPPPRMGGGGSWQGKGAAAPPPFDTAKVEGIVAEYPDKLKITRDGGKLQIFSDKYPGDDVVAKLKASGLRWDGATKRWIQP